MPSANSQPPQDDQQWETQLHQVESDLIDLRRRYSQLQRDRAQKEELETKLKRLHSEIEALQYNLESRLVTWKDLVEPFWLAVRFGGLGIVIGWLLKSYSG
jgi:predicted RNase H-like nuclease (RuvC/YqgF family)